MKKDLIPTKSNMPMIEFYVSGKYQKFIALIDTGAEISMANKSFVEENDIKTRIVKTKLKVIGLDSKKTYNNAVLASIPIEMVGGPKTLDMPICDLTPVEAHFKSFHGEDVKIAFLLGSDILTKFNAKVNYEDKTFTYEPWLK